jgi:hypothetical protein
MMRKYSNGLVLAGLSVLLLSGVSALAQNSPAKTEKQTEPGTAAEPIRYIGPDAPDMNFHDGRIPPVVGVHNLQVMRANRTHPNADGADGFGWTYSHAPMLAYWKGKFYIEYLSNPVGEHVPPGQTLLTESADGFRWSRPRVVFPSFRVSEQSGMSISHQRMGFYVAPDGRLLVLSFYGCLPGVNDGKGVGRAVRELYENGTLSPIYFIRYNRHAGWNETNTSYPFYKTAPDTGFIAACDALLANKLVTQQWWEEDRAKDGFFAIAGAEKGFDAKALSFFHRKDGTVVGLWKKRWAALSFDEGKSWTEPVRLPSIITGGAKIWGQRTDDGCYAVVYNPDAQSRWPLMILRSTDGVLFDPMLRVHGEIPYPRYDGHWKSLGPQYVRGIVEGNGNPPGPDMWVTYSMNKEDIWVSRIPVPIRSTVNQPVRDNFDDQALGPAIRDWNIYSPVWAPVALVRSPDGTAGNCLELRDEDRYDYAKAERVFPAATNVILRFRLRAGPAEPGMLGIEVLDRRGGRPVRLIWGDTGKLAAQTGTRASQRVDVTSVAANRWYAIELRVDTAAQKFDVLVNGKPALKDAAFAEAVKGTVERLSFRTGPFRDYNAMEADKLIDDSKLGDRLDGDEKTPLAVFLVDDVESR